MSASPLLFMPFLHKELCPVALLSSLLQLWPGLPNPQKGFHLPSDFPLTPQDAAQYVEHVRGISLAVANNVPMHSLLAVEKQTQHPNALKEAQDISAFAQGETAETATAYHMREARLAAQKALLRIWLLEERYLEVLELEQRYRMLSGDFTATLGVELEEEDADAFLLTQDTQHLNNTTAPSVNWRFLLENASFFLPEHSTLLFTDSEICAELRDAALQFTKTQEKFHLSGQTPPAHAPACAEAPLWKAFGMKGPRPERPWLAKVFSFLVWNYLR